jgi:hypothetical protein
LAALLVGCGGSSSSEDSGTSNSNPQSPVAQTAQFIDGYVEGLRYINGSNSGFTNANGEFSYTDGNISFYLGDMLLGTIEASNVPSDSKVFVQDLVGVDRNETTNTAVVKMARLLQTLDATPNRDSIEINATTRAAFDVNTTLANFPDANITNKFSALGLTAVKDAEIEAHLEDMRKFTGEVSDTTAPNVVSNASYTNVDLDDELCIDFSERIPKDMVTSSNFTVNPAIAGTLDRDNTEVCFTPDANLTAGQTYTITADGGITDYAGNALGADQSVSYATTAPATPQVSISIAGGTTQSVVEGDRFTLDLSASTPNTLFYEWQLISTAPAIVAQSGQAFPIDTLNSIQTGGTVSIPTGDYNLSITVASDNTNFSSSIVARESVALSVTAPTAQPTPSYADRFIIEVNTSLDASSTLSSSFVHDPYSFSVVTWPDHNLTIDCNNDGVDDVVDINTSAAPSYQSSQTVHEYKCTYATPGVYEVAIKSEYIGNYTVDYDTRIAFDNGNPNSTIAFRDNLFKITKVVQWGDSVWYGMSKLFYLAHNFSGIDSNAGAPNLSGQYTIELSSMFREAGTELSTPVTIDLTGWDVSNIEYMDRMFADSNIDPIITNWDTSSVLWMSYMFDGNAVFNRPLSPASINGQSAWDTSSVTQMDAMFRDATLFNQNISNWSIGNVTQCTQFANNATAFVSTNQISFTNCTP